MEKKLEDTEEKGKKIVEKGREFTETGQTICDLAHATRQALHVYTPIDYMEQLNSDWEILDGQAEKALGILGTSDLLSITSTVTGTTTSTWRAFNVDEVRRNVPTTQLPIVMEQVSKVRQVTERIADKQEVIDLMKSFGLDQRTKDRKSPVELFNTAHAAFERLVTGSNPISTSLIPMRQSILSTIDYFLKQLPKQEGSKKKEKILSIGRQLKRDALPDAIFQALAQQWEYLHDSLSKSKDTAMSRENWQTLLIDGTLFIKSLLSGVAPEKMKSRLKP